MSRRHSPKGSVGVFVYMAEQAQSFQPTKKELETLKFILGKFDSCRKARDKRYSILGDRSPKQYWDECEKRFTCYAPPKDVGEDEWQANVVMGLTRNAVLTQVAKTGMSVPLAHVQDWTTKGFMDSERSRIWENMYKWSLRRENADWTQQFVSLGNYVRGNACVYEGFEDKETEVEIVDTLDFETGEMKTKTEKISSWGPKRQVVPLDEIYYPNFFKNNLKDQSYVIWARLEDYDSWKATHSGYKNFKKVIPGTWAVPAINDPFFKPRTAFGGKSQVFVMRFYGNPREGGHDRCIEVTNGVPITDDALPFNHKRPPFGWALNEPFLDGFMLGCSVPMKMMDQQDSGDSLMNMALDKNAISMQKPVMTDDPDARVENFLYPGGIMKFSKGSTYEMAPIEGVTSGEFQFMQMVINQAKEFSGAYGGAAGSTAKGGKISARQVMMMEEEVKRQLAISLTNLESLERDVCIMRLQNLKQFLPGSGKRIEAQGAMLNTGHRGRFVAILAKSMNDAMKMEQQQELSMLEVAGEMGGTPTEAVAIAPDWFDESDRLEAEVVGNSSYQANSQLEQAVSDERLQMLINLKPLVPTLNVDELVRDNMEKHSEDVERLLSGQPQAPPQEQPPPGKSGGTLANQMSPSGSLNALAGTR